MSEVIAMEANGRSMMFGKLPAGWSVRQLKDIVPDHRRVTYGIVQPGIHDPQGVLLIRGQDYIKGWAEPDEFFRVARPLHEIFKRSATAAGDLLICIVGATTGATNIVPAWIHEANITQTTARISCDLRKADSFFVLFALASEIGQRQVRKYVKGSAQPGMNLADVECFHIPVPPLPQQRKIARILTTLDNVITQTEALIAKYQAIKQGLMHDLFTRGVDATGKLRPPQSEAPELYKQSELGWIPKEWEAVRLIEIAEVKGGKRLPAGQPFANAPTAFPYIRVSDMRDWTIDDSAIEYVPDHIEPFIRPYKISCDDLYISIAGVYLGLVGMVPTSLDNAQLTENAAKIVFRNKEAHSKEFLTAFFHSTLFFCQLEQVKGIGSGVPKLALHRIEAFMVPIPKRDEQNRIAESLLQIRAVITKECVAVSKAKDEKTGLMQDLLTGKVSVNVEVRMQNEETGGMRNGE